MVALIKEENTFMIEENKINTQFELAANVLKDFKNIIKGHKKASDSTMNYVLLEVVNKNVISVKYTNGDLWIEKMYFANVDNIGTKQFMIPIQFIKDLKGIKKNDTFIFKEVNENILSFEKAGVIHTISLADSKSFPEFTMVDQNKYTSLNETNGYDYIDFNDLEILKKASLSAAKSSSRPSLVELYIENGHVVSTDSHRLYKSKLALFNTKDIMINPILVNKAIELLNKDMFIKISYNQHYVKIHDDYTTKIYYTRNDNTYPNTSRLITTDHKSEIKIENVKDLVVYLKELKKDEHISLKFDNFNKTLQFELLKKFEDVDTITYTTNTTVQKFDNDQLQINCNATYLLNAIQQLNEEAFIINVNGKMQPFTLTKEGNNKELALIMPVRSY